jgi:hypothetical protein
LIRLAIRLWSILILLDLQVEIDMTHCGLCHTDIHMRDTDWGIATYPLVLGHEVRGFSLKSAMRAVGRMPVAAEPEPVHVSVAETTGSEAGGSEELMSPKQALADEPDMDPHSEEQQVEVKRKRGRPFKGQEKPIEERLMIETCKIRRLIDDVIRKGDSSEFFTRLRKIASDLDSVMTLMPSGERSEHILPNPPVKEEEEPITASEPQEEENTSNE